MRMNFPVPRFSAGSSLRRWLLVGTLFLTAMLGTDAATVTGTLDAPSASVGEEVTYELQIEGGSPDSFPPFPQLEGAKVSTGGRNSSVSIINGSVKQSVTFTYHLTPTREGRVEIPALEVMVDGQKYTTQAMSLRVGPPAKAGAPGDVAYGELSVERQPVYVGEDVVVDLRYYLDMNAARWSRSGAQMPSLDGEGYSIRNLNGEADPVRIGDKDYFRFTFHAVAIPNRAGKITIGPVAFHVPISKRIGSRNDPFGMVFERTQDFTVTAPALTLDVKPLPTEGRPKDFSGAIGNFKFSGQGTPTVVKVGDPVTMKLQVAGTGNFDRMGAPALADPKGWRAYKATDKFASADKKLDVIGTKIFEIAVVPEVKKTTMPVFNFSYFDPEKAKYFTLTNAPTPLQVEGGAAEPEAANSAAGSSAAAKAKPVDDILGIRSTTGFWGVGWQPRLTVWFALLVAPAPLIVFALFWRARRTDPRLAVRAALLREKAELLHRLRQATDRAELFDAAARILQIDVALLTGLPAGGIDEATILARCDSGAVKKMYAARAELVYAGEAGGKVAANERDQVLDTLAEFERRCR